VPQYGARNQISARVTSIKTDEVMSLVKFEVSAPAQMASVLTTESVEDLDLTAQIKTVDPKRSIRNAQRSRLRLWR
jgi:molybdopterin-binding protein